MSFQSRIKTLKLNYNRELEKDLSVTEKFRLKDAFQKYILNAALDEATTRKLTTAEAAICREFI